MVVIGNVLSGVVNTRVVGVCTRVVGDGVLTVIVGGVSASVLL